MILVRRLFFLALLLLMIVSGSSGCSNASEPINDQPEAAQRLEPPASLPDAFESGGEQPVPPLKTCPSVKYYAYEVVNAYPHDERASTQGLVFENGFLYEGTGLKGRSSLRKVQLETGAVVQNILLPDRYFGEGITICGDKMVQLTWQSKVGLVYDKNTFRLIRDFTYDTEGWGITYDGKRLIMSDGTAILYFLDPGTFIINDSVKVYNQGSPLTKLNELEFINGQVYANIWPTNKIAIIDPSNGHVTGWIDLSELLASRQSTKPVDVLNGIAYDAANDRLFVTGKLWPWLFEIKPIHN